MLIRIATRNSPLALWQAEFVKQQLELIDPSLQCQLISMQTSGDHFLNDTLAALGGKGAFVKELEHALLNKTADIAVHSMKDVPALLPNALMIGAYLNREDPRDALVSPHFNSLNELPYQAKVGTASLRRHALLKNLRPDLHIEVIRGNVQTRLAKLHEQNFAAIILAAAGLTRLGFNDKIKYYFSVKEFVPAINQGILGVECHSDNTGIRELLQKINNPLTEKIAEAERAFNRALGGSCHIPVAGYADIQNQQLILHGLVAETDGSKIIQGHISGRDIEHQQLGTTLAEQLIQQGADIILKKYL